MLDLLDAINRGFRPHLGKIPVFGDAQLRRIEAPLVVIVGGRDKLLDSADTARRLRRRLPHADVRMPADQPHFIRGQGDAMLDFLVGKTKDSCDGA
ncbi:hypothetical protein WS62_15225 [Burkholderia sp. ABCPW 14]|nr:hypothetical protein WS62_15225 [Burkholderia sp. ABCPW 14]